MSFTDEKSLDDAYVMHTFNRFPVEFVEGHGMTLVDADGKEYLDFLSGIGVCSLGHCHPVLVNAINEQVSRLVHVSNYFYIEHRGEVARRLCELAAADAAPSPYGDGTAWRAFFSNSGAEANEGALKLARLWSKRRAIAAGGSGDDYAYNVVSLRKSFHGRTLGTIAATMQDRLQNPFYPLPDGYLPADPDDVAGLEELFSQQGDSICAVLMEPIQGESGVHPLSVEFLQAARRLCDEHDALLIFDEVQCGLYRTGYPFAFQGLGVTPDIVTLAKGIAGGVPMGAFLAREELAATFNPGEHGSTFGGSNLACAAAEAVLGELDRMDAATHCAEVGAYFMQSLMALPHVSEVRGMGLMVGCDLDDDAPTAPEVVRAALDKGLVVNACGAKTLRFLPPLICERADVDAACAILAEVLA